MIRLRGECTRTLLEAVISAEGPNTCVGQDHLVASAVARSVFAILAAAPFFAASSQQEKQGRRLSKLSRAPRCRLRLF